MFSDEEPMLVSLVDDLLESIAFQEYVFFEDKDRMGNGLYDEKIFYLNFEKERAKKLRSNIQNAWHESQAKYDGIKNEVKREIEAIKAALKKI
jgi:hypothetical protein